MNMEPWGPAPFAAAADSRRPILLLLVTSWSEGCREVERTTFDDPRLAALVDRLVVPVRVDADERPDVAERYGLDGWPATLLLTDRGEILQGGTFVDADAIADLIERGAAAYGTQREEIASRAELARRERHARHDRLVAEATLPPPAPAEVVDRIARVLLEAADREHAGFAGTPKFLHADALSFLLRYGAGAPSGVVRESALDVARTTLDAADASPLCADGGRVFRCALNADWSHPVDGLSGEAHAGALRAFSAGCAALHDRYADRLRRIAAFVRTAWLPAGASGERPPRSILPTDLSADVAGACLLAAAVLEDDALGRAALALLERAALSTYVPGRGVRHFESADAPVLLSDTIATAAALLDAHDATGLVPYAMLAEELGYFALSAFFDDRTGSMRDRVHDARDRGLLAEPAYPFRLNARTASTLARLAKASGHAGFVDAARRLVRFVASRWPEEGLDAAACGIAALDLID